MEVSEHRINTVNIYLSANFIVQGMLMKGILVIIK